MSDRIRHRIIVSRKIGGDVLPGDFVRLIAGSCLGMVESIDNDHALVVEFRRDLPRSIVPTCLLMRVVVP